MLPRCVAQTPQVGDHSSACSAARFATLVVRSPEDNIQKVMLKSTA
jgi:hypothetical protein